MCSSNEGHYRLMDAEPVSPGDTVSELYPHVHYTVGFRYAEPGTAGSVRVLTALTVLDTQVILTVLDIGHPDRPAPRSYAGWLLTDDFGTRYPPSVALSTSPLTATIALSTHSIDQAVPSNARTLTLTSPSGSEIVVPVTSDPAS